MPLACPSGRARKRSCEDPGDATITDPAQRHRTVLVARHPDLVALSAPGLVRAGEPETVHPVTVVRDDAEALVAWIAPGTPVAFPVLADGRTPRQGDPRTAFIAPRVQSTGTWFGNGNIRVAPTGRPWSVWLFWNDDGTFDGYYANLEDPHVRDARNVYTTDHVLDVEVEPDRRRSRKDEDELAEAVRQGRYTAQQAEWIERCADEVERVADAWGSPFCDGWETFRAPTDWPVPGLPADLPLSPAGRAGR